jgi:hypothetical protein
MVILGTQEPQPSDFLDQAIEFAAAMDAYARLARTPSWTTMHFLIGRSMELALKAYALHCGADEKELMKRDLRHKLDAILARAEEDGFATATPLTEQDRDTVRSLSYFYQNNLLAYPRRMNSLRRGTWFLRDLLDRIIGSVYVTTRGEAAYEHDRTVRRVPGLCVDALIDYRE